MRSTLVIWALNFLGSVIGLTLPWGSRPVPSYSVIVDFVFVVVAIVSPMIICHIILRGGMKE